MMQNNYDVVISGSGYTGLTLYMLLKKLNLKVAILQPLTGSILKKQSRLFAIASGSIDIFKKINMDNTVKDNGQEINKILIDDFVNQEKIYFNASELELSNFGHMLDEKILMEELLEKVKRANFLKYNTIKDIQTKEKTILHLDDRKITTDLLIVSEGKNSKLRHHLIDEVWQHNYKQDAIIIDVEHNLNHHGVAIEKFLPRGPLAVLPRKGGYKSCIVWTDHNGMGQFLKSLPKQKIEQLIENQLGEYLGKVKMINETFYFPLFLTYPSQYYKDSVILCGDTLHSIHPIAGQGLNLGLRDVVVISELIEKQMRLGLDIGKIGYEYFKLRNNDINLMINATHGINLLFGLNKTPIKNIRKLGLKLVDKFRPLKNYIMSYASGYNY